jgi:cytochrome c oxidase cbb3-type subunit III
MPSFGPGSTGSGILTAAQISDVVSHVRTLSGKESPSAAALRGAGLFATNCGVCHGPAGTGGRQSGAPNLADAIWLYGGSRDQVAASVASAHAGVMPAWDKRLDPVTIKMLALYVHSLGGGEDFAPTPAAAPPAHLNAHP